MIEISCMRIAKKEGKRKSDVSSNEILKLSKVDNDVVIETEFHIYRFRLSVIANALTQLLLGEGYTIILKRVKSQNVDINRE